MKPLEAFLLTDFGKRLSPEQLPIAKKVFEGISQIHDQTVDSCIELVRKWGAVKQLTDTWDYKLLLEYLEKLKDKSTATVAEFDDPSAY